MSWSLPQTFALVTGLTITLLLIQTQPQWVAVVFAPAYIVAVSILWIYSPYSHRHKVGQFGPEVVKTGEWGFPKDE